MTKPTTITVVDYHCGNLRSVEQALRHCGANVDITSDPLRVGAAEKLLLPGVGAFPVGMAHLRQLDLINPIVDRVHSGTPLLGICLGMQLLLCDSEEHGGAEGLGIIPGSVKRLVSSQAGFKLPHIGWNNVILEKEDLLLHRPDYFYFVHSFSAQPSSSDAILAQSTYEDVTFCAALSVDNVWGMQFHPENSAGQGLNLLSRFIQL